MLVTKRQLSPIRNIAAPFSIDPRSLSDDNCSPGINEPQELGQRTAALFFEERRESGWKL